MIYGASTLIGKKILNQALNFPNKPILAGPIGQDLVELSFQTGLRCSVFNLHDSKKIQFFLKDVSLLVLCESLHSREHKRLLKNCLKMKIHYIDTSKDLFSYERLSHLTQRFYELGIVALPGAHPSVILSDLVASSLKSQLHDATNLVIACSESFTSFVSLVNSLQRGTRILRRSKLVRPSKTAATMLVPFTEEATLTVSSAQADMLVAWHSTRIPNIEFYRKSGEKEVRLRRYFYTIRWLLHLPFFKKLLRSQENYLIKHFGLKPFYPEKYSVWGRASNEAGKSSTLCISTVNDFDLSLEVIFKAIDKIMTHQVQKGFFTPSQILGSQYWADSENLIVKSS